MKYRDARAPATQETIREPIPALLPAPEQAQTCRILRRQLPGKRPEYSAIVVIERGGEPETREIPWLERAPFLLEWAAVRRFRDTGELEWWGPWSK